jgi:hypothetical protein
MSSPTRQPGPATNEEPCVRDRHTAVVRLVRAGLAAGLRLRRDRDHYTGYTNVTLWRADAAGRPAVVLERWDLPPNVQAFSWILEARGPGGSAAIRRGLTVQRAMNLLVACGLLPDPADHPDGLQ